MYSQWYHKCHFLSRSLEEEDDQHGQQKKKKQQQQKQQEEKEDNEKKSSTTIRTNINSNGNWSNKLLQRRASWPINNRNNQINIINNNQSTTIKSSQRQEDDGVEVDEVEEDEDEEEEDEQQNDNCDEGPLLLEKGLSALSLSGSNVSCTTTTSSGSSGYASNASPTSSIINKMDTSSCLMMTTASPNTITTDKPITTTTTTTTTTSNNNNNNTETEWKINLLEPPTLIISDWCTNTTQQSQPHHNPQLDEQTEYEEIMINVLNQLPTTISTSTSSTTSPPSSPPSPSPSSELIIIDENIDDLRRDSVTSMCSTSSFSSSQCEDNVEISTNNNNNNNTPPMKVKRSHWRKLQTLVTSPFIQTYKRQKYPWIQLAGHQGNFISGRLQGTILKKLCGNEVDCFQKLMSDPNLAPLVPKFKRVLVVNNESYLELEDLLATFVNPSVMDIKMGTRTYLEEELVKAKEKPKLRKDMYEKMVAIDPDEPRPEEKAQKAITKPRYMVWRESISSTSTLGFRIDGIKLANNLLQSSNTCSKDLKRTKSENSVRSAIWDFADHNTNTVRILLEKLMLIRDRLIESHFFRSHEMIGSSLLFVHDQKHANVWMIDFAKTYPLPDGCTITHRREWQAGNHEDGYLIGMDNLIRLFNSLNNPNPNPNNNNNNNNDTNSECSSTT